MPVARSLVGPLLVVALGACDRSQPPEPRSPPGSAAPAAAETPAASGEACAIAPTPRRPMPKRLVAIGDLHGDLAATRAALRAAGAIDEKDRWIGGALVVVQTGDMLDRGDDEQAILDLFARLEREASAAGGALIALLGNHELMNAAGDFRYVLTQASMSDFDDAPGIDPAKFAQAPAVARGRLAALAPGGVYAKWLGDHDVVAIVGDTIFSHAGVLGAWATQVDEVNRAARCWMAGKAGGIDAAPLALTSSDSPVWSRAAGGGEADCAAVKQALAALGVSRMVVGHTVQREINALCDGAVWRIDVGLSKYYGGPIQVLELTASGAKVISGAR